MKGLRIDRATPSNAIDIYALLKQAAQERVYPVSNPNAKQLQNFYLGRLLQLELPSPYHFYYLAKRGRGFLGLLHAVAIPGRWDGNVDTMLIELLFVAKKYRKKGVAKKLLETLRKEAENVGVRHLDLASVDDNLKFWGKYGAKQVTNYMRIKL
jgi:GNAT superfamily N-acetyltransferase